MGDYKSLEEVTEENWRKQQAEAEVEDPGKADAVKNYENSMQQDTAAVITDGEESEEDYVLDYGFEDLEDSSSDDDCCAVSVFDSGAGECEQEPSALDVAGLNDDVSIAISTSAAPANASSQNIIFIGPELAAEWEGKLEEITSVKADNSSCFKTFGSKRIRESQIVV